MQPGTRRGLRIFGRVVLAVLLTLLLGALCLYGLLLIGLSDRVARIPDLLWQALNIVPPVLLLAGGVCFALGRRWLALGGYGLALAAVAIFLLL